MYVCVVSVFYILHLYVHTVSSFPHESMHFRAREVENVCVFSRLQSSPGGQLQHSRCSFIL